MERCGSGPGRVRVPVREGERAPGTGTGRIDVSVDVKFTSSLCPLWGRRCRLSVLCALGASCASTILSARSVGV